MQKKITGAQTLLANCLQIPRKKNLKVTKTIFKNPKFDNLLKIYFAILFIINTINTWISKKHKMV